MIAFLANTTPEGKAILEVEFGQMGWAVRSDRRVVNAADPRLLVGMICSTMDHLRGLELSGFVVLPADPDWDLVRAATARVRKPFYWHGLAHRSSAAEAM